MSGFEVAGIALATFPILVNGLRGMTEGPLWKKPVYEESLRSRLDGSYNIYLQIIKTLADSVVKLRDKLGINDKGGVQWDSYSIIEREMEKIKLTLRKRIYKELLDDIDSATEKLQKMTQQEMFLEPMRRKRRSKRPIAELKLIRKHAASLYQVLMNDKAWKCSCKSHHMASLRLEARPQTSDKASWCTPQDYVFRILMTVPDGNGASGATARWEELEVIPSLASQKLDIMPVDRHHHSATKQRVRFASIDEPPAKVLLEVATAQTDLTRIQDMCTALSTPVLNGRAIGLLVDDAFDKHQHKLYRADTATKPQSQLRSLENLLESSRQPGDDNLSRQERLQIAVVLASSVLQLDGTSWLKNSWSSSDIYFYSEDRQPSKAAELSRSPYLSWQPCCGDTSPPVERFLSNNHMIRNDTLLALGLVLVELCFGRTLVELRKPEDSGNDETATKLQTATRLRDRVDREMGPQYGDVVRRCLDQPFDVREMSLDLEEVQQKVLEDIVAPLVKDLESFNRDIRVR
ncbi:MAG: hypothetical protein Q9213_008379 [Squamulea squamosa]